jgi:ElaB/YqjD/DUF883 family membrane-anchored ribosome-binding protein
LHYQKSEYPLDYTKTASAPSGHPQDHGADSLADRLNKATDGTQEAADRVAEQVRELSEKSQEAFDRLVPSIEKAMKERPIATLAVASLAAFALGILFKK